MSSETDERSIGLEIRRLGNLIRRSTDRENTKKYIESITGTNGWIIAYVGDHSDSDVFQRDLEERFQVRRSTTSRVLKLMEQKGFLSRVPVDYDARLKKLVLTDKGLEIYHIFAEDRVQTEIRLRAGLDESELNAFFSTVDKIKSNLGE